MAKTLYVGNLPWNISEEDLKSAFAAQAPVIAARIITDKGSGRSKGFGFIEVEDSDAAKVVEAMNDFELGGRKLTVNEARPRSPRV